MTLPSTLADWLAHCELLHPKTIDMTLDRVLAVRDRLGLRFSAPVISVAGTNGKGSSCAMLEAIALQAGYRVGLYIKPHLLHFEERCRINGELATADSLLPHFEAVEAARGSITLTWFEFTTLAILRALSQAPLDLVILEVGMGGRLDAVNAIDADCALITSIALDHTEFLGPDRETIAIEKAGIMWPAGRWWSATPSHPPPCRPAPMPWAPTCGAWGATTTFRVTSSNGPGAAGPSASTAWPTRRCAAPTS